MNEASPELPPYRPDRFISPDGSKPAETSYERAARVRQEVATIAANTLDTLPHKIDEIAAGLRVTTDLLRGPDPYGDDTVHESLRLSLAALQEAGDWAVRAAHAGQDSLS